MREGLSGHYRTCFCVREIAHCTTSPVSAGKQLEVKKIGSSGPALLVSRSASMKAKSMLTVLTLR